MQKILFLFDAKLFCVPFSSHFFFSRKDFYVVRKCFFKHFLTKAWKKSYRIVSPWTLISHFVRNYSIWNLTIKFNTIQNTFSNVMHIKSILLRFHIKTTCIAFKKTVGKQIFYVLQSAIQCKERTIRYLYW